MDRLASMTAFIRTVEAGSFAAAASVLGISPQMVAKHVAYLEARIGTRLLNRTTRRQSLTEIGQVYYDRCRLVLAEADWADSLADEAKGTPRGLLRISAPVTFGTHRLMEMVASYVRRHPEVEVDVVLDDRFVDLIEGGFDAIIRIGPLAENNLKAVELAPFRLLACASPAYLQERGAPVTPADLDRHECIGYVSWPEPAVRNWRFVRDGRIHDIGVRSRLKVNNAAAMLQAALAGFGIVFIAEDLARASLASGHLIGVLPDYESPVRPMHLLYQADRRQTPKLKSFIRDVMAQFGSEKPI